MNDPYQSCAGFYNFIAEPWLRPVKRLIVKECLRLNCSEVLDLGCGTGTLVRLLREGGIQATGLDLSPSMLGESRKVFRGSPILALGRGEKLPFASRSFRGVVLTLMIHENPPLYRRGILKEALRVLAPGGTLFILEYHRTSKVLGRIAGWIEYAIERAAGRDHFRNYRLFMREGALRSFLAPIPPERTRWHPVFFHSMALVQISPGRS